MNLYDLPADLPDEELCRVLAEGKDVRIEWIVSRGQITPEEEYYDQEQEEWIAVLSGRAQLTFYGDGGEERQVSLAKGDTLLIGAHQRHRVAYTSQEPPCIWLCVFADGLNSPAVHYK